MSETKPTWTQQDQRIGNLEEDLGNLRSRYVRDYNEVTAALESTDRRVIDLSAKSINRDEVRRIIKQDREERTENILATFYTVLVMVSLVGIGFALGVLFL